MHVTYVFEKLLRAINDPKIRGVASEGGARSSKTWSMLQILFLVASLSKKPKIISCVASTLPAVKRGMLRDFKAMLLAENAWNEKAFNKTEGIYEFPNGSIMEFFGCDNAAKVHGPARDILFVNEAQNISKEVFRQLDIRTRQKVFIDYNPTKKFWAHSHFVGERYVCIHSTYKDNPYLPAEQVAAIEANAKDLNWWRVYGQGLVGGTEGLIYPDYDVVEEFPDDIYGECLGLDFGFVNDPTAILRVGFKGWDLYVQLLTYRTGMLNDAIAADIIASGNAKTYCVCDSAEQKSIADLARMRIKAIPCIKGKGSIKGGISQVKQFSLHVVKSPIYERLTDELDNYKWVKNEEDETYTNTPIDTYNHALDALRYATEFLCRRYRAGSGATKPIDNQDDI